MKKTMCQLVDAAKQFYGSGFSDETYENAKKVLTDPNSKWTKLINCVLDQTDPPCGAYHRAESGVRSLLPRH